MDGSTSGLTDAWATALDMAREHRGDGLGLVGYGVAQLRDGDGLLVLERPFANLVTDAGDLYYASKAIVGISPANASVPTAMSGMQIGSGTTAVAKNGTGSALVAYLAGAAFDSGYPQIANLGAGNGVNAVYRTTYGAGAGTGNVTEAAISSGSVTGAAAVSATISRVVFTAIAKGSNDSLSFTWNHQFKGA